MKLDDLRAELVDDRIVVTLLGRSYRPFFYLSKKAGRLLQAEQMAGRAKGTARVED